MLNKKAIKTQSLTPELAKHFASMKPLPGEREIKKQRIDFLESHVRRGSFFSPEWAVVLDRSNNEVYRANGQHSSTMLAALPEDVFPKGLHAYITEYEMDSQKEDGLTLFELFDNPASVRSTEDVMGVGAAHHPELMNIKRKFLVKVSKGITAFYRGLNEQLRAAYERGKKKDATLVAPEYAPTFASRTLSEYYKKPTHCQFACWLWELSMYAPEVSVKNDFIFSQPVVVAVMFSDWKRDPLFATSFWGAVVNESDPNPKSYSRDLATELNEVRKSISRKKIEQLQKLAFTYSKKAAVEVSVSQTTTA